MFPGVPAVGPVPFAQRGNASKSRPKLGTSVSTDAKSVTPSSGEAAGESGDKSESKASEASRLTLEVNGDSVAAPFPCTIIALLDQLGLGGKRVAVAVNRDVVIRGRHAEFALSDGDRIEILEAVGGG